MRIKRNKLKTGEGSFSKKINQLVEGTEIKGDIISDSNFRIDGKVQGTINITGKLVLGVHGLIEGDLTCENAEIEGKFKGTLTTKSFLSLKSTAVINGDIYAKKMAVEPGALFTGNCIMGEQPIQNKTIEPLNLNGINKNKEFKILAQN